ncbi:hypothetical protein ACNPQK_14585 [Acinetobacter guillouiae]|jgi:hypothetical protein|uniref:Uncharacterized protein n=1 Tax=Acinetobacter guillouiae TaxID=106649 RepID=A0A8X8GM01_ACIGI|nr:MULTISPECIES: hypothetical protein [Acinetobacter]MCF0265378.1 hypothetical protein [Acinetobacter guillouiae]MRT37637.1 hypothetical protein [Acinetobacter sp. RIT698]
MKALFATIRNREMTNIRCNFARCSTTFQGLTKLGADFNQATTKPELLNKLFAQLFIS